MARMRLRRGMRVGVAGSARVAAAAGRRGGVVRLAPAGDRRHAFADAVVGALARRGARCRRRRRGLAGAHRRGDHRSVVGCLRLRGVRRVGVCRTLGGTAARRRIGAGAARTRVRGPGDQGELVLRRAAGVGHDHGRSTPGGGQRNASRRRWDEATWTAMRWSQASAGASGRQRGHARKARRKVSWAQSSAAAGSRRMARRVRTMRSWLSRYRRSKSSLDPGR
jgi:hypothetical protein